MVSILETGPYAVESSQLGAVPGGHVTYHNTEGFSSVWRVNDTVSLDDISVSIGTYPGASNLVNSTVVSDDYVRGVMDAGDGVPTYVTVTAIDKAGLVGVAYSKSLVLDTSSPPVGQVSKS